MGLAARPLGDTPLVLPQARLGWGFMASGVSGVACCKWSHGAIRQILKFLPQCIVLNLHTRVHTYVHALKYCVVSLFCMCVCVYVCVCMCVCVCVCVCVCICTYTHTYCIWRSSNENFSDCFTVTEKAF